MTMQLHKLFNRTNAYTLVVVLLLFAVLPLSQRMPQIVPDDDVLVRRVDIAPPPPPPPPERDSDEGGSMGPAGLNLESLSTEVNLAPVLVGTNTELVGPAAVGLGEQMGLGFESQLNYNVEGVGFGDAGLDRPPIMIVRPTLNSEYMRSQNISEFDVEVMVKWNADGSLTFIDIEYIQYPDPELELMVREAVARIRYSRPTVNGQAVERFIHLPLTIHANRSAP